MSNIVSFHSDIVKDELKPFYIITGEEIGLINYYISQIKRQVKRETSISSIWRSLTTKGIVSKESTYVVRDDDEFLKNDKINSRLSDIRYGTLIILITTASKYKKFLNKYSDNVITFDRMTPAQLDNYFKNRYKEIDAEFVEYIVDRCDYDFSKTENELDKLIRVKEEISYDLIDQIVYRQTDFDVFKAIDSVLLYQPENALLYIEEMFAQKISALGYLTLLYNNFVSATKVFAAKDPKPDSLGISQYQINKAKYEFKYTKHSALEGMKILGEVIQGIKLGKYEEKSGTYIAICKIFNLS